MIQLGGIVGDSMILCQSTSDGMSSPQECMSLASGVRWPIGCEYFRTFPFMTWFVPCADAELRNQRSDSECRQQPSSCANHEIHLRNRERFAVESHRLACATATRKRLTSL